MKYLNLKKITAVVLSIGMVFSSSAVTGFAADNSKKIATIPNSYINKVAEDIDNEYFYDGTYVDDWGHTRKGRQLGATYTKESTEFLLWAPAATYVKVNIYATGDDNDSNARDIGSYALEKMLVNGEWNGIWIITLLGEWGGRYYDYTITTTDITHIGSDRTTKYKIQDPYSVAVSKDGKRSYITDTSSVSGYTFLSKTGDEKGVYTSETQTVTYYYNAINPDTVVDGIKNNGVYCEKAQFKVTSSDYTQVMAGNKTLTPDVDGIYTVSAADGTQTITLTDNEGYSIYLSVTVNANHTMDNSDCTKESICSVCGKIFLAQANHKFSDTWTKDDTYHWKVCENDGCTVTTTKTKHSGTDDGDCTTPVICECGEIVTAAKSEHIYGEWKSNGNGTHTHKCTTAGCTIEETESCVGGAATCKKRAVCTDCNAEYGTLNPANHSGNQVWVQTEKTHQKKYDCCGAEVTNIVDHIWDNGHCTVCGYDCIHKGGEATCTQKAVCDTCHSEYGEINADNHTGTEKWTQTATTHEKKYDCCGKVTIEQENHRWKDGACETCGYVCVHSGGEATCTKGAVCKTCGKEYTDKDMANHSGKVVWVQTEKTHKQAYDCCDKEVSTSEAHGWKNGVCTVCDYQCKHAGGSATCVKKAVCTICSEEYGTYNMSIHEGLKSVAAKAATRTDEGNIEYWYCKDCDRYYIKQDGLVEIEKSQTVVAKITDTTSSDYTGKGDKTETVKEQTPDTGDNKRVFAWLLMFIIGGAAAGLTIKGKKTEN